MLEIPEYGASAGPSLFRLERQQTTTKTLI